MCNILEYSKKTQIFWDFQIIEQNSSKLYEIPEYSKAFHKIPDFIKEHCRIFYSRTLKNNAECYILYYTSEKIFPKIPKILKTIKNRVQICSILE